MYHIYLWIFMHPLLSMVVLTLSLLTATFTAYKCMHGVEVVPCLLVAGLMYILLS